MTKEIQIYIFYKNLKIKQLHLQKICVTEHFS